MRRALFYIAFPLVLVLQLLVISGGTIATEIISDPIPPKVLTCFDFTVVELITSDVEKGCPANSESLGADPIPAFNGEATILNPLLALRFKAAQASAKKEGVPLRISSGFRSRQVQGRLFADEVMKLGSETEAAKWVLPPLYSHHPQGTAIDVNYNFDRPSTKWLEINGYKFGICRAYANEWWHFEGLTSPGVACPPMKVNALVDVPNGAN